ncbi:MAG: CDP-alcohol phosphatidyltransferase family protein [Thermomicrobiales bacterium]
MAESSQGNRRHIPQRKSGWAIALTQWLQRAGVKPNQISILGLIFSAAAAACLIASGQTSGGSRVALLVIAALCLPFRLLCNMVDGMLAVECGMQGPDGLIYNEIPDRLSDLAVLAAAGYAAPGIPWAHELGWIAAITALLTAYVRTLGVAAGASEHFDGPMAKPRRMHVMIGAALLATLEPRFGWPTGVVLLAGLVIVTAGSIATIVLRLRLIGADLGRA